MKNSLNVQKSYFVVSFVYIQPDCVSHPLKHLIQIYMIKLHKIQSNFLWQYFILHFTKHKVHLRCDTYSIHRVIIIYFKVFLYIILNGMYSVIDYVKILSNTENRESNFYGEISWCTINTVNEIFFHWV